MSPRVWLLEFNRDVGPGAATCISVLASQLVELAGLKGNPVSDDLALIVGGRVSVDISSPALEPVRLTNLNEGSGNWCHWVKGLGRIEPKLVLIVSSDVEAVAASLRGLEPSIKVDDRLAVMTVPQGVHGGVKSDSRWVGTGKRPLESWSHSRIGRVYKCVSQTWLAGLWAAVRGGEGLACNARNLLVVRASWVDCAINTIDRDGGAILSLQAPALDHEGLTTVDVASGCADAVNLGMDTDSPAVGSIEGAVARRLHQAGSTKSRKIGIWLGIPLGIVLANNGRHCANAPVGQTGAAVDQTFVLGEDVANLQVLERFVVGGDIIVASVWVHHHVDLHSPGNIAGDSVNVHGREGLIVPKAALVKLGGASHDFLAILNRDFKINEVGSEAGGVDSCEGSLSAVKRVVVSCEQGRGKDLRS